MKTEEKKELAQGPFGLWEPTASPTPTIAIPEGEVIWMADYVDKRTPVEAKGVYVSPDVAKDNAYMEELPGAGSKESLLHPRMRPLRKGV